MRVAPLFAEDDGSILFCTADEPKIGAEEKNPEN